MLKSTNTLTDAFQTDPANVEEGNVFVNNNLKVTIPRGLENRFIQ
jgi:hypothetical protein